MENGRVLKTLLSRKVLDRYEPEHSSTSNTTSPRADGESKRGPGIEFVETNATREREGAKNKMAPLFRER